VMAIVSPSHPRAAVTQRMSTSSIGDACIVAGWLPRLL
jgi:hypothetical protein